MDIERKPPVAFTLPVNVDYLDILTARSTDDVVAAFSKGFEEDLRRIMGSDYKERPSGDELQSSRMGGL